MTTRRAVLLLLPVVACLITGCGKRLGANGKVYAADVVEAAEKLKPAKDPVQEEMFAFRVKTRPLYNNRKFDALETLAAKTRAEREICGDGTWRITEFYESLACRDEEQEGMWMLHDQIHQQWLKAKPDSITAHVAYADFLAKYAWQARGDGMADTVTQKGWNLFNERLAKAKQVLDEARKLPEKDPVFWDASLRVALGQNWKPTEFDALLAEAVAFEPKYWKYDLARAKSLLPRWYGKEGDWEAFAEAAAKKPHGLGAELYARIVLHLHGFYENVFVETKASWPTTRAGLEQMLASCPKSLDVKNEAAKLATMAQDQAFAKKCFDLIGDVYFTHDAPDGVWESAEQMAHCRRWANTGKW